MAYHWAQLRKAIRLAQTKPVVMDRWWPSEIAYGNVYRSGPEAGYHYEDLHRVAKLYGVSYTFCMPMRFEQYWERFTKDYKKDQEMYPLNEGKYNHLWRIYRDLAFDVRLFDRELLEYYNLVLDQYRCDWFARHIIQRWKAYVNLSHPETKIKMKELSSDWKSLGRVAQPVSNIRLPSAKPTQLSLF